MARVGFCGLGRMGAPMAARLVDAGHDVVVWNRTAQRVVALVERGARPAASPAEAAAGAEALFTMVSAPDALDAVLFGDGGAAAALGDGATLVEMSTVGPAAVAAVRARLRPAVALLDAPVLGSVPQATDGSLKVFVGGDAETFGRWEPVLARLGRPVLVGPLGAGASMKLVANSTLGALMTGLAEALSLADGLGLEQAAVLDALAESPIGATVRSKRANIESGRYSPPNFTVALAVKDLSLVADAAGAAGVELRVSPAARSWLGDAERAGLGPLDYSAVIAHARRRRPASPG